VDTKFIEILFTQVHPLQNSCKQKKSSIDLKTSPSWSFVANWLTMSFMRGSLWLSRHVARSTNLPCKMVVWLSLFNSFLQRLRTQGGLAEFGRLLIYLGNVLSHCVCDENAKFPKDLLEETVYRVALPQYLRHVYVYYKVLQWWRRTWVGLLDWTYSECHRESQRQSCAHAVTGSVSH